MQSDAIFIASAAAVSTLQYSLDPPGSLDRRIRRSREDFCRARFPSNSTFPGGPLYGFPFEGFLRVENPVIAKNGNRESGIRIPE